MRLSFYSGLALAMIAADNAKAQEQQKEPKRAGSFLAQASNNDEDSDQDWAAFAQSQGKTNVLSDIEGATTADSRSDLDSQLGVFTESDAELDS